MARTASVRPRKPATSAPSKAPTRSNGKAAKPSPERARVVPEKAAAVRPAVARAAVTGPAGAGPAGTRASGTPPVTSHVLLSRPAARPAAGRVAKYAPSTDVVPRKVWILGCESARVASAVSFLIDKGHDARGGEPGGDVGAALRTERPDLVVIDMETEGDRGRHIAVQMRADRGTRQLPIVLVGVSSTEGPKVDRAVPGPTRRYAGTLNQPTVLEAIYKDL